MAILHSPRPTRDPAPTPSAATLPRAVPPARPEVDPSAPTGARGAPGAGRGGASRGRREWLVDWLPIVGLAITACLTVGYGIGTLAQFDRDWRAGTPTRVATAAGTAPMGQDLDAAVTTVLATGATPVTTVQCPEGARVTADLPTTVCRGRAGDAMVSIVAAARDGRLLVAAYSAS